MAPASEVFLGDESHQFQTILNEDGDWRKKKKKKMNWKDEVCSRGLRQPVLHSTSVCIRVRGRGANQWYPIDSWIRQPLRRLPCHKESSSHLRQRPFVFFA